MGPQWSSGYDACPDSQRLEFVSPPTDRIFWISNHHLFTYFTDCYTELVYLPLELLWIPVHAGLRNFLFNSIHLNSLLQSQKGLHQIIILQIFWSPDL